MDRRPGRAGTRTRQTTTTDGATHEGIDMAGQPGRAGHRRARPADSGAERRDHRGHLDRDLRFRPAPVRGAGTVPVAGRRARARGDGRGDRGRRGHHQPGRGRPGGHPVQHLLRALLDVRPRPVRAVRDHPGARAGQGSGAVRLHIALRFGAGRAGAVPAGPAGPVRPGQDPAGWTGRAVPVPVRRAAHRVPGRCLRGHPQGRDAGRARPGADRAVLGADRPAPRDRAGHRGRPGARAAGRGGPLRGGDRRPG